MIQKLYNWYGKRNVLVLISVVSAIVLIGLMLKITAKTNISNNVEFLPPVVQTAIISTLTQGNSIQLIGSVEAVNEARIDTETSGRVISVYIEIGETIAAGTIIAELENASERAAVLQAEGTYEIALASASQSDISVIDAETSLSSAQSSGITAYRSAFTVSDDVARNLLDNFFSETDIRYSGFRLNAFGQAVLLGNERTELEDILDNWSTSVFSSPSGNSVKQLLIDAKQNVERVAAFTETLTQLVSDDENDAEIIEGISIDVYRVRFLTARTNLNTTLQTIETALNVIENAEETLLRAKIGGTSSQLSAANAVVKQALGALRAAQANLAKTIIRSPLSGTVNVVTVSKGDFVSPFESVAVIANNEALEITTFVGERDRGFVSIDGIVTIEGVYQGVITKISPALNPETRKFELKIQFETSEIINGDTVRIMLNSTTDDILSDGMISIPITAVKFSDVNGMVFTVLDDTLISHEIQIGNIRGSFIEISDGITSDMEIVIDARGLSAGQKVEVVNKN